MVSLNIGMFRKLLTIFFFVELEVVEADKRKVVSTR